MSALTLVLGGRISAVNVWQLVGWCEPAPPPPWPQPLPPSFELARAATAGRHWPGFGRSPRDANSRGPGGPPGPLCLAIAYDFYSLPVVFVCDLMEVTILRRPWLSGSHHPRSVAIGDLLHLGGLQPD
jgi:hypothetical protein